MDHPFEWGLLAHARRVIAGAVGSVAGVGRGRVETGFAVVWALKVPVAECSRCQTAARVMRVNVRCDHDPRNRGLCGSAN